MLPISEIIVQSQKARYSICEPLSLFNPGSANFAECARVIISVEANAMCEVSEETRGFLREILFKRFFTPNRFLTLEMQVIFHPSYRKLSYLGHIMPNQEAETRRKLIRDRIGDLALLIESSASLQAAPFVVSEPPRDVTTRQGDYPPKLWNFPNFGDNDDPAGVTAPTLEEIVSLEINVYHSSTRVRSGVLSAKGVLRCRSEKQGQYPLLSPLAKCVLGHKSSSAQIERDFRTAGLPIIRKRNRTDIAFVGMTLFPNVNMDSTPSGVPELRRTWREQILKQFSGADEIAESLLHDAMNFE
ncbi:hypothetical protein FGB62_63g08 [Gracilaria domingensis]|nr:hypothetical protein FGB62_63g08 [Gracilaria domingensis]